MRAAASGFRHLGTELQHTTVWCSAFISREMSSARTLFSTFTSICGTHVHPVYSSTIPSIVVEVKPAVISSSVAHIGNTDGVVHKKARDKPLHSFPHGYRRYRMYRRYHTDVRKIERNRDKNGRNWRYHTEVRKKERANR